MPIMKFVQHKKTGWKYRAVQEAPGWSWELNDIRQPFTICGRVSEDQLHSDYDPLFPILVVDFDGTIAELIEFPNIGECIPGAREALLDLHQAGYRLLMSTCRTGAGLEQVKGWLRAHNLDIFEKYNEQADDILAEFKLDCRKIYGHFYFGDDSFGWPGWSAIRDYFLGGGYAGRYYYSAGGR